MLTNLKVLTTKNNFIRILKISLTKPLVLFKMLVLTPPGCTAFTVTVLSPNLFANSVVNKILHSFESLYIAMLRKFLEIEFILFILFTDKPAFFAAKEDTLTILLGADFFNLSRLMN